MLLYTFSSHSSWISLCFFANARSRLNTTSSVSATMPSSIPRITSPIIASKRSCARTSRTFARRRTAALTSSEAKKLRLSSSSCCFFQRSCLLNPTPAATRGSGSEPADRESGSDAGRTLGVGDDASEE